MSSEMTDGRSMSKCKKGVGSTTGEEATSCAQSFVRAAVLWASRNCRACVPQPLGFEAETSFNTKSMPFVKLTGEIGRAHV